MSPTAPICATPPAPRPGPPVIELLRAFPTRWAEHGRASDDGHEGDALGRQAFLAMLEAMSHPGRIVRLPDRRSDRSAPMPASLALARALLGQDTPVWLGPGLAPAPPPRRTDGMPWAAPGWQVAGPRQARLAMIQAAHAHPRLWQELGSESPAPGLDGATLLIEVPGLLADPPPPRREPGDLELMPRLRISTPGLLRQSRLAVDGLARHFWRERIARQADGQPADIELLLVCADRLAAIPRGARVQLDD